MSIKQAKKVLRIEAEGILRLIDKINNNFTRMVKRICDSKGRVIVSGIGKSGIVGQKIVATLNSTGTQSLFLHPVEAMHGDLGMVSHDDIFLALSNSGETDEINILIPSIRKIGCPIIAFTGDISSTLAKRSDIIIDVGVEREACPLGLAPTASTTAMLAMGDALAVALISRKKFKTSDFKKIHPGGVLGHRLSSKIQDIMLTEKTIPYVYEGSSLHKAIKKVDKYKLGVVLILTENDILSGIITDGDIRRIVAAAEPISELTVDDVMTKNPKTAAVDMPVYDALNIMERHQITALPVTDPIGRVRGILHLHDILGKGEFKFNGS